MRSHILLLALLSGCLAPKYVRPDAPVDAAFPGADAVDTDLEPTAAVRDWRSAFPDPLLQDLVERALANNRDLRATALTVEEARTRLRLASAALGPAIQLEGSFSTNHTPASVSPFGEAFDVNQFRVGPTVSWEIDLFGRLRYQRQSAAQATRASAEDWRAARLALIADVVSAALQERVLVEQRDLAQATLEGRRKAADLVTQRLDAGVATELDRQEADALVASAEANLAVLQRGAAQAHNALVLLVGEPVEPLPPSGPDLSGMVQTTVPPGLPSDLLEDRPDIRAAELRLQATHADIGAAKAAFFPRISLTGGPNTASSALTGLFQPGTLAWQFVAPTIVQPLVGWGQKFANLSGSKIAREKAIARYEGTIQSAFREVADVLVAWPTFTREVDARDRLAQTQATRLELATQRYEAGVADYLSVLDAERSRFSAEQSLMQARLDQALLAVSLFRVVGGGLEGEAELPERDRSGRLR